MIHGVLTHARGTLSARDAGDDEESHNSCEDDTNSNDSDDSSSNSSRYVIESFQVMFLPKEELQHASKLGMRKSMEGEFFKGVGVSLNIIIM